MTDQRRRGYEFELAVVDDLRGEGYETIRSAGSKGKIDVLAYKQGQILVVQVKISGIVPPNERIDLLRLAGLLGAIPLIAWKQQQRKRPLYDRLIGPGARDRVAFRTDEIAI